jgi:hypothetical protein
MTILPYSILNEDDDYIEELRGYWYPRIHPVLTKYTPAYGVATVSEAQFVREVSLSEDALEAELTEVGFARNPLAAFKSHPDGRESEGSWVLIPERDDYGLVEPGMQLHITLLPRTDDATGRAIYAHYEDDWRVSPLAHLRSANFDVEAGVTKVDWLLDNEMFL